MTLGFLKVKEELRGIVDAYALLSDEKRIADVMQLFTPDATYSVYMNGAVVAKLNGTEDLENDFNGHASQVKTYFTLNGQHTVSIDGDTASGISFSQIKMIREADGKDILSDYSVRYDDSYVIHDGKWFIKQRKAYFIIVETRILN